MVQICCCFLALVTVALIGNTGAGVTEENDREYKGPGSEFMQQRKGSGGAGDSNGENNGDSSEKSSDKKDNESKEESLESSSGTGMRGNFSWIGDNNCTAEIKVKSGKIFGKTDCP